MGQWAWSQDDVSVARYFFGATLIVSAATNP